MKTHPELAEQKRRIEALIRCASPMIDQLLMDIAICHCQECPRLL
jgi:hypothetical protein